MPQQLATRFVELLHKVGIRQFVSLRYSQLVDTSMVIGVLKPVILLLMGLLSGLSMEQVECILIHELGHVRRWDYLLNLVQSIAEIILFCHLATCWVVFAPNKRSIHHAERAFGQPAFRKNDDLIRLSFFKIK